MAPGYLIFWTVQEKARPDNGGLVGADISLPISAASFDLHYAKGEGPAKSTKMTWPHTASSESLFVDSSEFIAAPPCSGAHA